MEATETPRVLQEYLREGRSEALKEFCHSFHPAALAEHFDALEPEERVEILSLVTPAFRAELVGHLEPATQVETVDLMPDNDLARMVTIMPSDERVDLLKLLPEDRREEVLRKVAKTEREDILRLVAYKEGTAGAIMTSEYAILTPDLTAREAIDQLRTQAPNAETIYYAYVVDEQRRPQGLVSLKDLIVARSYTRVEDLMARDLVVAQTDEDQEEVARKLSLYDLLAVPVVNADGVLVGIVTFDDVLDVTEAEATTDFHRMGASGAVMSNIRDASLGLLYRKRIPWLLILVFVNIFSGYFISRYEATIDAVVALVFFLPLLIGSGGNAGAQSATLAVRALAVGDVQMRDWLRLLGKEVFVALTIGVSMAVAVWLVGMYIRGAGSEVALVVAVTMVAVVLVGSLIGMLLPFVFTLFRLDPASASVPLVTSLCDIVGVLIYFSIATWYLHDYIVAAA
ncbi:MAG: magnesium transporter [Candidatus Hydrogenedentota bacterium]